MKKALILLKDDEKMMALAKELQRINEHANERLKFMEKQVDNLRKDSQKKATLVWDEIEKRLEELKLFPPEYKKETHAVGCDYETGVVSIC